MKLCAYGIPEPIRDVAEELPRNERHLCVRACVRACARVYERERTIKWEEEEKAIYLPKVGC